MSSVANDVFEYFCHPTAGLPATVLPLNVHVGLWSVAIVVSVAGIVFSLFLIAFNIILRKKRLVPCYPKMEFFFDVFYI